jgi:hypothetical protein
MAKVLYFFPDTNVFVQCHPLGQLDWSAWKTFDEVHLIVSRPVQSEIDKQKNKGSDRLGKRARTTSSLFREIILADTREKVIREAGPRVKIVIHQDLRPSPDLADRLDYTERDHQLVGIAYAFVQQNPGSDARLLTDDTGPMASAQMVSIPFVAIPDNWLLPPQPSETERKIGTLQAEVARLRDAEPDFRIGCVDRERNAITKLKIETTRHMPLTDDEILKLMDQVKERFPIASDFGLREPTERPVSGLVGGFQIMKEVFTPATEDEIAAYREVSYPKWIEGCERTLRDLHKIIESGEDVPAIWFAVVNEGNRPARGALITVEAKGDFAVLSTEAEEDEKDGENEENGTDNEPLELRSPPRPPVGIWRPNPIMSALDSISAIQRAVGAYAHPQLPNFASRIASLPHYNPRRDPNRLYWKPHRPLEPTLTFSLECEQWRHGVEPELFGVEIHFKKERDSLAGALECRIHAENLTDPAVMLVPIRIRILQKGVYDTAEALVQRLVGGPFGALVR